MLSVEVKYAIDNCEELIKLTKSSASTEVKYNILCNKLFNEGLVDTLFNLGMSRSLFETLKGSTIEEDIWTFDKGLAKALRELKKIRTALEA